MYSLDINFLNDRPEYRPEPTGRRPRGTADPSDKRVTLLGLGAAAALLLLSGGAWFFLQTQNTALNDRLTELNNRLSALKAEQSKYEGIVAQTKQIKAETAALAGVFNAIKPWSAMFEDISSRTPPGIRILDIVEEELPAEERPSPSPVASPTANATPSAPPKVIEITGAAASFNDVNDFLLVLQNSRFLKADQTRILTAALGPERTLTPLRLGQESQGGGDQRLKLAPEVIFTIRTALTDVPASELVQELESKKATGLVTRIESLQQKGVDKP